MSGLGWFMLNVSIEVVEVSVDVASIVIRARTFGDVWVRATGITVITIWVRATVITVITIWVRATVLVRAAAEMSG